MILVQRELFIYTLVLLMSVLVNSRHPSRKDTHHKLPGKLDQMIMRATAKPGCSSGVEFYCKDKGKAILLLPRFLRVPSKPQTAVQLNSFKYR